MKPWQHVANESDLLFWMKWLDDVGDDKIARIDWLESYDAERVEREGLSRLRRVDQARILRALDENLRMRATIDKKAPGSQAIAADASKWLHLTEGVSRYVTDLQVRTVMKILGYRRSTFLREGRYNVSLPSIKQWERKIAAMR